MGKRASSDRAPPPPLLEPEPDVDVALADVDVFDLVAAVCSVAVEEALACSFEADGATSTALPVGRAVELELDGGGLHERRPSDFAVRRFGLGVITRST